MARRPASPDSVNAPDEDWVVTHAYEGPNRRKHAKWLLKRKGRLADAGAAPSNDAESIENTLRRLNVWAGLSNAQRDQRAGFLATIEALTLRGRQQSEIVWPDILDAVARYLRAVGANGKIDEQLLTDALHAAQVAHAEGPVAKSNAGIVARLDAKARAPH